MSEYTVRLQRGADGWWTATVKGLDGCITQGKSIAHAMTRAREALAQFIGDRKALLAELAQEIVLPGPLATLRQAVHELTGRASALEAKKRAAQEKALGAFTRAGFSMRDMGLLFGVSHQRVSQRAAQRRPKGPAKVRPPTRKTAARGA